MTKRQRQEYEDRKFLQDAGWKVTKDDAIRFNSGSETLRHFQAKCITAYELSQRGHRIDSEVVHEERGELDLLAYGNGRIFAVELETSPTDSVVKDKLDRYYRGTPLGEVYVLNISEMPCWDAMEMREWVQGEL